ncbi:YdaS family helix-turn-helix protein [Chitinasiproducens palmae]|uniref:YdaS family helix-turn-helix protein n=1 Tax=Chitinasiproducens palmae TaxID=1770053 RepID=UPI000B86AEAA
MNAIDEAIAKAGGVVALATALGLDRYQTVQSWQRTGSAPAHVCPDIERVTGVSRRRLNRRGQQIWPEPSLSTESLGAVQ